MNDELAMFNGGVKLKSTVFKGFSNFSSKWSTSSFVLTKVTDNNFGPVRSGLLAMTEFTFPGVPPFCRPSPAQNLVI